VVSKLERWSLCVSCYRIFLGVCDGGAYGQDGEDKALIHNVDGESLVNRPFAKTEETV
jgi:hypothetical protein